MSVNERIRLLREALGMKPAQFAAFIGVPRTTLIGWEDGKGVPIETAEKLCKAKPDLSITWLLTGEGEMFQGLDERESETVADSPDSLDRGADNKLEPPDGEADEEGKCNTVLHLDSEVEALHRGPPGRKLAPAGPVALPPGGAGFRNLRNAQPEVTVYRYRKGQPEPLRIDAPDPEGFVLVPLYSQTAAAGPGQEPTQLAETESLQPVLYDLFGIHRPENCGLVRVVGDSMSDVTLSNGDWVLFDTLDRKGDGIFVISMFGEVRVKRLQYRLADRKIVIASENARRYPEPEIVGVEALDRGDLIIYGRVFSWFHRHHH